jgi:hypothetical protein
MVLVTADQPPPVTSLFDPPPTAVAAHRRSVCPSHHQVRSGRLNRRTPAAATRVSVTMTAAVTLPSFVDGRLCPIQRHSRPPARPPSSSTTQAAHQLCCKVVDKMCSPSGRFQTWKGTACPRSLVNFVVGRPEVFLSLPTANHCYSSVYNRRNIYNYSYCDCEMDARLSFGWTYCPSKHIAGECPWLGVATIPDTL